MRKGKFITIEGIDGCGKGSQVALLKEHFKDNDNVVFIREPGGEHVSEEIRKLILDNKSAGMCDMTEFLLFSASRAQLVKNKLLPLLEDGKIVICERFSDSSVAYQGFGRGLDILDIMNISKMVTLGLVPDMTLYLKISPQTSINRITNRNELDRIEKAGISLQEKVCRGYDFLSTMYSSRYVVIDGEKSIEDVSSCVIDAIDNFIK